MLIKIEEDNFALEIRNLDLLACELVKFYMDYKMRPAFPTSKINQSTITDEQLEQKLCEEDAKELEKIEEPVKIEDVIKPEEKQVEPAWPEAEDEIIKTFYLVMSVPAIRQQKLPHRSERSIYDRAYFLGMKKYKQKAKEKPEKTKPEKTVNRLPLSHVPNKTDIFLNWLEQERIKAFRPKDFLSTHQDVTEEELTKIILHQIKLAKLRQWSNDEIHVLSYRG